MIAKLKPLRCILMMVIIGVVAACRTPSPQYLDNRTPTIIPTNTPVFQTSTLLPTETLPVPSQMSTTAGLAPSVLISGFVDSGKGTGNLESIYNIESKPDVPTSGIYVIRFEDDAHQELASYSFEAGFSYDSSGLGSFVLVLPWNSNTTRIVLLKDEVELDSRMASSNAPSIQIISPNGGESLGTQITTVSWSAVDEDGDLLKYVVQYSIDGGQRWVSVAVDWTANSIELDLNTIPNTDAGLIRVFATDGFYTSQDQSDGLFRVAGEKTVYVDIFDGDGGAYSGDQSIILDGEAYTDYGQLPEATFTWSSDIDGVLGEGEELSINAQELTEGTHTITLTAEYDDMKTGSESITIHIYRHFSSLSVGTDSLNFTGKLGEPRTMDQIVEVWHLGDESLIWSAEADQNWIVLTQLGNETPANLLVLANLTGLSAGTYNGTITISSNAKGTKTQTITVTLVIQ